jgi:hypothetical protein
LLNDDSLAALVLEFNLVYRFAITRKEGKKFGATRRSRTGDLLITNSDKAQNEPEPADETPQKTED